MSYLKTIYKKIKNIVKKSKNPHIKPIYIPITYGEYLKNRTILITGGTSGIGFAIAKACIKNNANIIITGRDKEKIKIACDNLNKERPLDSDIFIIGKTLDIENVESMASEFKNIFEFENVKQIDCLINNAGVNGGKSFGLTTIEEYDKVININLKGTYFLSQIFSNYLIESKIEGNILNILSSSSLRPATSPYRVSKWGELGLTKGLAKTLIKYGIVVNAIAPGPTATKMLKKDGSDLFNATSPSRRYSTAEEIANFSVFLISDMGRMIVGDTIYMTGGCGNLTVDDII